MTSPAQQREDPAETARLTHEVARGALEQIETLLEQHRHTMAALADRETLEGVGNLDLFAQQAETEITRLRGAYELIQRQHQDLRVFLAAAGVPFRPIG